MAGRPGRERVGGLVRLQTAQLLLYGGERACVFPGKKTEESILGTGGIQWQPFGLLMGCSDTMAEGGLEEVVGLLRMNSHHIHTTNIQAALQQPMAFMTA